MNPKLMEIVVDVADVLRGVARNKALSDKERVNAADTLVNLLHVVADIQHNSNETIMAAHMEEFEGGDGKEPWRG